MAQLEIFPHTYYLNLSHHDCCRRSIENELLDADVKSFTRLHAINRKWVGWYHRGYPSAAHFARALSHKRAIWTAWRRKLPSVVILEDEVVLESNFLDRVRGLDIPDDGEIIVLGYQQMNDPIAVNPGLVRCTGFSEMFAYMVRSTAYRSAARILLPFGKRMHAGVKANMTTCEAQFSRLCERIPVYAPRTSLAGRRVCTATANRLFPDR